MSGDLRESARALVAAEVTYRLAHDLHGDGHIITGRAWDKMRNASLKLAAALSNTPEVVEEAVLAEREALRKSLEFACMTLAFIGRDFDRRLVASRAAANVEPVVNVVVLGGLGVGTTHRGTSWSGSY